MTLFSRASLAVVAALIPSIAACTGGQLTDPQGNPVTGGGYNVMFSGPWDAGVPPDQVQQFWTGVADNGLFSFDPDAPGSASNNSVMLQEGAYFFYVFTPDGDYYETPHAVDLTYNNVKCQDFYVSNDTEPCALFQIQLYPSQEDVSSVPPPVAPTTINDGVFTYTVVPVYPMGIP